MAGAACQQAQSSILRLPLHSMIWKRDWNGSCIYPKSAINGSSLASPKRVNFNPVRVNDSQAATVAAAPGSGSQRSAALSVPRQVQGYFSPTCHCCRGRPAMPVAAFICASFFGIQIRVNWGHNGRGHRGWSYSWHFGFGTCAHNAYSFGLVRLLGYTVELNGFWREMRWEEQ